IMSRKKQEEDERFRRVQKDPRFWEMPEKEQKVKIDKRFQSMFHDQRFKVKQTVDKRGRPVSHSTSEDLRRFYKLSDSDEDDDDEPPKVGKGEKKKTKAVDDSDENGEGYEEEEESDAARGSDDESSLDSGDDSDSGPDLARGKGNIETSSDEDDDDDDVEDILKKEEEEIEHDWGELCKDAPRSDEVSARIAVCNMDWDRMKAKDLLALFNSFTPKGGAVLSVKIYPSEFGKERLKMEETQGPPELKALPDDSEDDTEEEKVYREKLRDYQFKRLKYFYAVVECDSPETAAKIYEECDGYEYESSCSVLDLRFIPDDVMFEEEPKDVATDINLSAYQPKLFTSSATATSKVQLTWDETDHERVTALSRKFNKDELLDLDFKAYLASSSEEDEDEEQEDEASKADLLKKKERSEEQINKYRELLNSIQVKEKKLQEEKDMEMEITWVPGLRETTEKLVKKKLEGKDNLTPWEEYLEKKKEKKKQKKSKKKQVRLSDDELPSDVDLSDPFFSEELGTSDLKKKQKKKKEEKKTEDKKTTVEEEEELEKQKAEMALLMEDDEDEAKHKHFNYDKIVEQQNLSKKKRKKLLKKGGESLEEDDFKVDVSDPRFQAMFTSHLFNLDPSHPSFKKTKATQSILEEKHRRRELGLNAQKPATASEAAAEPGSKQEGAKREKDSLTQKKAMDPSLSLLVKSIKSKTEQFQARKKQKVT
uniref:ESF1, nucleolar pre-rRNA processing protein, homolog (S. cerevisiae) n=1 Tax=Cyprinodon variegatus TaxID=28743 RepID=A0A3Q2FMJ3_CYPVA